MRLKIKYATYLLLVLFFIMAFTAAIVASLTHHHYLLMVLLCAVLYLATYGLGKKLRRVFFVLSLIKFIKDRNGSVPVAACRDFVENSMKPGTASEEKEKLSEETITLLIKEEVVETIGDHLVLRMD